MPCSYKLTKKYVSRPSPAYPAQECRGKLKIGNDDNLYKSVPDKNGVYKWKKHNPSKKSKKSAKKTSKKSPKRKHSFKKTKRSKC